MRRIPESIWVFLSALGSALLLFLPSISKLGQPSTNWFGQVYETFFHTSSPEYLLGDGVDPVGSIWIVGFVEEVLFYQRPTEVAELYFPYGLDLGVHEGFAWLDTLFAIPLRWMIGSPGFYHLHVLCTLIFSFIACYALFKLVSKNMYLSLLFAHLMVVNEFVYQEMSYGRPTQVNWLFGALFGYCAYKILEVPRDWKWPIAAGISFAGYCLTYWFGAAGVGFIALFWLIVGHLRQKEYGLIFRNALLVIISILAVILPICWRAIEPIVQGKGSKAYSSFLDNPTSTLDFLGLSLPIYSSEVILSWNDVLIFVNGRHYPIALLMIFGVVFIGTLWQRRFGLSVLLWVALLLPVGSALKIGQTVYPTSYALLEWIFPPLVRCNFPDRLMLAPLLTTTLVGLYLFTEPLFSAMQKKRTMTMVVTVLVLSLNLGRVWTSHTPTVQAFSINKALVQLGRKSPGALIEFPFDLGNNTYVQSEFHRQPILAGPGMMMIQPDESKGYRTRNSILADMNTIEQNGYSPAIKMSEVDLLELHKDGFRHVVLYTKEITQPVGAFERYFKTKGTSHPQYNIHIIPLPEP